MACSRRKYELYFWGMALVISLAVLLLMARNQEPPKRLASVTSPQSFTAYFLPSTALCVMCVSSLLVLVGQWRAGLVRHGSLDEAIDAAPENGWPTCAPIAVVVGYLIIIPLIGLIPASAVCMASLYWLYGVRHPAWLVGVPVVTTAVLYLVFVRILSLPLP